MGRIKIMKQLAGSVFVRCVVDKLKTKNTDRTIRCLGIGSSTGTIESLLIDQLLDCFQNIENTVVEPSAEAIAEYKSATEGRKKWSNVKFSWFNGTFKQIFEEHEATGKAIQYDHICFIDSIYYLDNLEKDLLSAYDRLADGGIMTIMVVSANNSNNLIEERFPALSLGKCVTSQDVIELCEEQGLSFERYRHECYTDITGIHSSPTVPHDDKLLLDFWVQKKDFKENVSKSVYDEVVEFIKGPGCSIESGGKLLFRNDFDIIFIEKKF